MIIMLLMLESKYNKHDVFIMRVAPHKVNIFVLRLLSYKIFCWSVGSVAVAKTAVVCNVYKSNIIQWHIGEDNCVNCLYRCGKTGRKQQLIVPDRAPHN